MPRTKPAPDARPGACPPRQEPATEQAPLPPRRGRGGALLGALAALVTLLVLLVGVPALLVYGTGAVAAMGEVAPDGVGQLLTSPDDGRLFLWLLVVVGWLGWACFALSVLLEVPAQLRGRIARRIPAFGWSQRMAAGLVGSVIALLPVAGSAFAAVPDRALLPSRRSSRMAGVQRAALPAAQAAPALAPAADQQPTYTVRDSFYGSTASGPSPSANWARGSGGWRSPSSTTAGRWGIRVCASTPSGPSSPAGSC